MKVFSFEDLNCGKVPKIASFQDVVDRVRVRLNNRECIYGGLFLGSTICHQPRLTSDVDVLVMPKSVKDTPQCKQVFRELIDYAASLFVPLSFNILPFEYARMGDHTITHAFYLHLQAAAARGGIFGENPLYMISLDSQLPIVEGIRQTILRKMEYIRNWIPSASTSPSQYAQFLSYLLSIAPSISLNMLYAHSARFDECNDDGVYGSYVKTFPRSDARDALQLLYLWRERYDEMVTLSQVPVSKWPSHSYLKEWNEKVYLEQLEYIVHTVSLFATIFLGRNLQYLEETG